MARTPEAPARPEPRAVGPIRLRVVRGPKGERWYWRATRYSGGGEAKVWVGWGTVEEADLAVAKILAGVAHTDPSGCRTVQDLLSLWHGSIEARDDITQATVTGYAAAGARLNSIIGLAAVDVLGRETLERYRNQALRNGRTPRTVQHDLKILHLAWRYGQEVGLVEPRPLPLIPVRIPELDRPPATPQEVAEAVRDLPPAQGLHLLLLWSTGCRVSEIGRLRRKDVRGSPSGRIWIAVTGKRRRREVPLPDRAAVALRTWMDAHPGTADGWVLGLTPASARGLLHRHLRELGVSWTPQATRRRGTDRLYAAGKGDGAEAALLGHSAEVALRHYRRVQAAEVEGAMLAAGLGDLPELPEAARAVGDPVVDLAAERRQRRPRSPHKNPHNIDGT